jgi:hypothetical protein
MKFLPIALLCSILLFCLANVSGWAGFRYLPPEKKEQLRKIAVAQGYVMFKYILFSLFRTGCYPAFSISIPVRL